MRTKDEDRLQPRVISLFNALGPHLQRAFRVSRTLAGIDIPRQGVEAFETVGTPIFLVSASGRTIYANAAARDTKGEGAQYVDHRSADLRFLDDTANARLASAIHSATRLGTSSPAATFQVPAGEGRSALATATIVPFLTAPRRHKTVLEFAFDDQAAAVVFLQTASILRKDRSKRLLRVGLSEAEVHVVLGLCEGSSLSHLASIRGTSINTIRNQVQAAFSKLGVRRQGELVARVLQLP
jgi:DNA-binding CsgD family transcriptional regulator